MHSMNRLLAMGVIVCAVALQGCSTANHAAVPPVTSPAAPESAENALSGKVVETMNGGGYTYLCLEQKGQKLWAAIPVTEVKVGDQLQLEPGMAMKDFQSKALNRTFESIIFSGGVSAKAQSEAAAAPVSQPGAAPAKAEPPLTSGKVVETLNAGGYTYICLEKDGRKGWAAVPATAVKVGDEVTVNPGATMNGFRSKSLKRSFDRIIFSSGVASK